MSHLTAANLASYTSSVLPEITLDVHARLNNLDATGKPKLAGPLDSAAATVFNPVTLALAGQVAKSMEDAALAYFGDAINKGIDVSKDTVRQFVSDKTIEFLEQAAQRLASK